MPRDFSSLINEATLDGMSSLAPQTGNRKARPMETQAEDSSHLAAEDAISANAKRNELHPYTQTLSLSDLESCVRLEEAAFPPQERASREKLQYRLKHAGELFLGIFTSQEGSSVPTAETSAPVYTGAPQRKAVLLGYIGGTKTTNPVVKDEDMAIPDPENPDPRLGHKLDGKTVCIHSLGVLPQYQKCGLGTTLMKAYLQRLESHGVANRVALIAHDHLIPYYEKFGFEDKGKSEAQFGGGGWYDLARDLKQGPSPS
ncbi:acyl- N-acyltransferase [Lecanosticta acicola]|uniref:Acyl- N-acyltransferase n=1 Tax=Lecanosticta acicola TaxID=111012 RepID=A0AAI8Z1Q6_9PEZI|nr:acyl- N-acyltransferase [Lecanosticta acicola]